MRILPYLQSLATDYSPRVHANGFIQIDITKSVRLHIWGHHDIPRQRVPTPIHDHTFNFTSRVLFGALNDRLYSIAEPQPESAFAPEQQLYQLHVARVARGDNTTLFPEGPHVIARCERSVMWSPMRWDLEPFDDPQLADGGGDTYTMCAGEFHESIALMPSASVIIKDGASLAQGGPSPRVLVPIGQQPSNEFDRHAALTVGCIWQIVTNVVRLDPEAIAAGIAWALQQERALILNTAPSIIAAGIQPSAQGDGDPGNRALHVE